MTTTHYALDVAIGLAEVIFTSEGHKYLHLPGVIMTQAQSQTRYLLSDGLGSIRQVTNEAGQVVAGYEYDPYGNPIGEQESGYGYTGEFWQSELGLLHLRARWYDPSTGTFLSKDPWPGDILRSLTKNGWSYVEGNPINRIDPTGLCSNVANQAKGCPDWMADWAFNGLDWVINATAKPAYSDAMQEQSGNIDDLKQQAQNQHTGIALTPMGLAVDFTPGYGDVKGFVEVFTGQDLANGTDLGYLRYLGVIGLSELRHLKQIEEIGDSCELVRVLYHGTDNISADLIRQGIDPNAGRKGLDFDPKGQGGFYVTKYLDQAVEWAKRRAEAPYAPGNRPVVLKFVIPEKEFQRLNGKTFREATEEWGQFVKQGRSETLRHSHDYVEGPMARPPYSRPRPIIREDGDLTHQIGVYTDEAARLFDQYLHP